MTWGGQVINDGQGYTDTIKQRYMHLDSITVNDKTTVSSSMLLVIGGNTGNKTTGAHLHYSVYTKDNIAYSDTSMKILFGKNYQTGSMYNGSWRTVYNPTSFYKRYR